MVISTIGGIGILGAATAMTNEKTLFLRPLSPFPSLVKIFIKLTPFYYNSDVYSVYCHFA
jgi:ABC-type uncharacterized transport system permease subunit